MVPRLGWPHLDPVVSRVLGGVECTNFTFFHPLGVEVDFIFCQEHHLSTPMSTLPIVFFRPLKKTPCSDVRAGSLRLVVTMIFWISPPPHSRRSLSALRPSRGPPGAVSRAWASHRCMTSVNWSYLSIPHTVGTIADVRAAFPGIFPNLST